MLRLLSSLRLFYALAALLAAAFLWQTLYNRGAPVYGSPWFAALGLLLAANIAACAVQRGKRASAHYILLHSGLVLVIAGSFLTRLTCFEAEMPLRAGEVSDTAYSGRAAYRLPFSLLLRDFRIEYYGEPRGVLELGEGAGALSLPAEPGAELEAGGARFRVLRAVRDFGLAGADKVVEKSPYWHNPAVQVELSRGGKKEKLWLFANFPGMHGRGLPLPVSYRVQGAEIKSFVSAVTVRPAEGAPFDAEISVNAPLRHNGYSVYQASYDPADASYTLLTVRRDRGVWAVYAGFAVFLAGVLLWLRK